MYHNPALLLPTLQGLKINPNGVYADCTFGGGGHSRSILEALNENGQLLAFDHDSDAVSQLPNDARLKFIPLNFKYLLKGMRLHGVEKLDGILADLGVSFHQFDTADRGFSIRFDGPLDMRMNKAQSLTAAEVLNKYSEEELTTVFWKYGELEQSRKVARKVVEYRSQTAFETTFQLVKFLEPFQPFKRRAAFLARAFQALRIVVNSELEALENLLEASLTALKPGGRLVIISYHSLEDRMVKHFMREGSLHGEAKRDAFGKRFLQFELIGRKAIEANEEEIALNPRSRSAKLRIAERNDHWK